MKRKKAIEVYKDCSVSRKGRSRITVTKAGLDLGSFSNIEDAKAWIDAALPAVATTKAERTKWWVS